MSIEFTGMTATRSDPRPRRSLRPGPLLNPEFTARFAQAHEAQAHEQSGFDRVLMGYGARAPEGWGVANAALRATERLKVLIAHRPGFVAPTLFDYGREVLPLVRDEVARRERQPVPA